MTIETSGRMPQPLAFIGEAARGDGPRVRAMGHAGTGTISRDRMGADQAEEDDPAPSRPASYQYNDATVSGPTYRAEFVLPGEYTPASGGPQGPGGPDDPDDPSGPDDHELGDNGDPPHSDGGLPTPLSEGPMALGDRLHSGVTVSVAGFKLRVGMEGTESDAPQHLNLTSVIIVVVVLLLYTAYTATHAASMPSGTLVRLAIILLPPAGVLTATLLVVRKYTPVRAKMSKRTADAGTPA